MKLWKPLAALTLTAALLTSGAAALTPEEAFPAEHTYPGFIDVETGAWYADAARVCCEVGLMQGTGHAFSPDQILTVGEVAVIAARMNAALTGEAIPIASPKPGETLPWYFSYVTYLEYLGVDVPDPEKTATRQEFVSLLAAVVPEDLLPAIHNVTTLPDSSDADVLRFYNAGILAGLDSAGTFAPDKTLTRAECAAMVARIVRTDLRLTTEPAATQSYTLFVGQAGQFRSFPAGETTLDPAGDTEALVGHLLQEMAQLTGWNLDTTLITSGKGGITVGFSSTSSLFVGPPETQKDEFHVYDAQELTFTLLDSVQETLRMAFSPSNPEGLEVWFCGPDGNALTLDTLGVTLPVDRPYSHTLLEELLSGVGPS